MARTAPFDLYAGEYDRWFAAHPELFRLELAAVRRLLPDPPGAALEVGVGTGRFAAPLGIRFGVEPAWEMAVRARAREVAVVQAVAEALPFAAGAFDVVLMVTALCFFDRPRQAVAEAWRVLRPGGILVAALIDRQSELGRQYRRRQAASRFYRQAVFYGVEEAAAWLAAAGFDELARVQTLFPDGREAVRPGSGKGGFVVLRGLKKPPVVPIMRKSDK
jgi:SAM-dependent methyltransferase